MLKLVPPQVYSLLYKMSHMVSFVVQEWEEIAKKYEPNRYSVHWCESVPVYVCVNGVCARLLA